MELKPSPPTVAADLVDELGKLKVTGDVAADLAVGSSFDPFRGQDSLTLDLDQSGTIGGVQRAEDGTLYLQHLRVGAKDFFLDPQDCPLGVPDTFQGGPGPGNARL